MVVSNTSGAIQAALPLLLVIMVCLSQAVPKSQIFNVTPRRTSSKLGDLRSLKIKRKMINIFNIISIFRGRGTIFTLRGPKTSIYYIEK